MLSPHEVTFNDLTPHRGPSDNMRVYFRVDSKRNEAKTRETGLPFYDPKEMIQIRFTDDPTLVIDEEVEEKHRVQYAQQYEAFLRNKEVASSGFPLQRWAAIDRAQAETLTSAGIRTVEQLAKADRKRLEVFGIDYLELPTLAQGFLDQAGDQAKVAQREARITELESAQEAYIDEIKALRMKIRDLEEDNPRRPAKGR